MLNLHKQSRNQIHAKNKGRCYFYQNFLHVILRNMISETEYTLEINQNLVRVTSHNISQAVKPEILAATDGWLVIILSVVLLFFIISSFMESQVKYLALFHLFSVTDFLEWFWTESLQKNTQLIMEFLRAPFLVLHCFLPYINDLPDVICNTAIYADNTTVY